MQEIAQPLLRWFDENKRSLPFRAHKTPYRVWVSEVMLQQTRVAAVLPYYERFMRELPTVQALAACPPEKLAKLWEGLGYYSRARNLQRAAQAVVNNTAASCPPAYEALRALPGIGDYTAGAVASLAFGLPYAAVDGNVLRVWSRLHADDADISAPATKRRMAAEVQAAQPAQRPGGFNEALMELGALVCLPNGEPLCAQCPGAASAWPENRAGRPCCRLRRRAKRARRFAIRWRWWCAAGPGRPFCWNSAPPPACLQSCGSRCCLRAGARKSRAPRPCRARRAGPCKGPRCAAACGKASVHAPGMAHDGLALLLRAGCACAGRLRVCRAGTAANTIFCAGCFSRIQTICRKNTFRIL